MFGLLLWLGMGCTGEPGAAGENAYEGWTEGLWSGQALTIRAGMDEALSLIESGELERGAALALQVYEGSFEPEMEPAIREVLGPRAATEMEFRFGVVVDSLRAGRGGASTAAELMDALDEAAARLDEQRVEIR
ncbi:MAG: hypothetical protein VX519_11715 [Myxococcota bacterium]|nr:hypothetical protein [Myxococcota bacterium]